MSGHSKWANIQHRKGKEDAKRGKLFTKWVREISVAVRLGSPDPDANPRLRAAIVAARKLSMPNDNIKRAIEKGAGTGEGCQLEEVVYEGYGPGGVAFIVETVTDNKNRTTPEIRHLFSRYGGNMGEPNSVAWQFERRGFIQIPKSAIGEDQLTEDVLESGADDYQDGGETWDILTAPEQLHSVREYFESKKVETTTSKMIMMPSTEMSIEGDTLQKVMKLVEAFDDHDDVQNVYNNADFDESALT